MRIYLSGQNLFTLTNYSGVSPEVRYGDANDNNNPLAPGIDREKTYFRTRSFHCWCQHHILMTTKNKNLMKKIIISFKVVLVTLLLIGVGTQQSCTKLDEEVYSDITGDKLFENPDNLIYAFGTAYTNLYQVFGHKYGIGMDAGTDILCVPQRGGDWLDGGEWHRWHRLTYTPSEAYVGRWWNTIFYGVNTCNRLIFQFEALEDVDVTPAVSELRALRALYYYWLIDIYGNVPIQTDFNVPADFKPSTKSRQEVYDIY